MGTFEKMLHTNQKKNEKYTRRVVYKTEAKQGIKPWAVPHYTDC